jgi:sugar lactone lactonase YvrE
MKTGRFSPGRGRTAAAFTVVLALGGVVLTGGPASATAPGPGILAVIAGQENVCAGPTPGPATSSALCGTAAVAVDASGNIYVADPNNDEVEKITATGILSVFAGQGATAPTSCTALSPCPADQVALFEPDGVAVDPAGNVYIADFADHLVEKVTPAGSLSVLAGTGANGHPTPGPATASALGAPNGVGVDSAGDVYIADSGQYVEKVTPSGTLSIFAGTGTGGAPTPGPATNSKLNAPNAVAFDSSGNAYIADVANNVVERVTPSGMLSVFAGTGTGGAPTPGPAASSKLSDPEGVIFDRAGNAYIADANNNVVERVTPSGTLSVFAGTGTAGTSAPGPATSSRLHDPGSVAVDGAGNVYIADSNNNVVEEVGGPVTGPVFTADTPPATTSGVAYSYTFTATGNPPPTFAVSSGSLPAGLALNATSGLLAGTPTGSGTFRVSATNTAGSVESGPFTLGSAVTAGGAGVASTPDGAGYWMVGSDGSLTTHGTALSYGSMAGKTLARPVVGMAATTDGKGYWLVATDGGVFSFGDATFHGSAVGIALTRPVVAMATTPDGKGYWLVASDGGVFSFGDAVFYGSASPIALTQPIVGMATTPDGKGYWLVATDGGVFSFGDAVFYGSASPIVLRRPIVGMATTPDGKGYWLVAADGGVFGFGDARFAGSGAASGETAVGLIPTAAGTGYVVIGSNGDPLPL